MVQINNSFVDQSQEVFCKRKAAALIAQEVCLAVTTDIDNQLSQHFSDVAQWFRHEMQQSCEENAKQVEELNKLVELFRKGRQDLETDSERIKQLCSQISNFVSTGEVQTATLTNPQGGEWNSAHVMNHNLFFGMLSGCLPHQTPSTICSSHLPLPSRNLASAGGGAAGSSTRSTCGGVAKGMWPQVPKLSLADALGIDKPDVDAFVFDITLRVAEGCTLGLATSTHIYENVLLIDRILPGGAVEAWNQQCITNKVKIERALRPGDRIVSINDVLGNAREMVAECERKSLLRLRIVRRGSEQFAATASVSLPLGVGISEEERAGSDSRQEIATEMEGCLTSAIPAGSCTSLLRATEDVVFAI